jgi:hypothetical protein
MEGQKSDHQKFMVYANNINKWEPNRSIIEKKLQRIVTACKDFG